MAGTMVVGASAPQPARSSGSSPSARTAWASSSSTPVLDAEPSRTVPSRNVSPVVWFLATPKPIPLSALPIGSADDCAICYSHWAAGGSFANNRCSRRRRSWRYRDLHGQLGRPADVGVVLRRDGQQAPGNRPAGQLVYHFYEQGNFWAICRRRADQRREGVLPDHHQRAGP